MLRHDYNVRQDDQCSHRAIGRLGNCAAFYYEFFSFHFSTMGLENCTIQWYQDVNKCATYCIIHDCFPQRRALLLMSISSLPLEVFSPMHLIPNLRCERTSLLPRWDWRQKDKVLFRHSSQQMPKDKIGTQSLTAARPPAREASSCGEGGREGIRVGPRRRADGAWQDLTTERGVLGKD